jgi:zinc and cadmium transporter
MVHELAYTLIAVIIVSLISLVGIFAFFSKKKNLDKILFLFVAFSAGTLLGTAFFDLIPESMEKLGSVSFVLVGIILFFLFESFIHWHHDHRGECDECLHPVAHLSLIGDGLHNLLDGIIISAGFLVSIPSGIAITLAIALHEIPQEIGDFAILIRAGMKKSRAIFFNLLSASLAIVGGLIGFLFLSKITEIIPYIIAIAAGGFIYIAGSDIFPELHKEKSYHKILTFLLLIIGILLMLYLFSS